MSDEYSRRFHEQAHPPNQRVYERRNEIELVSLLSGDCYISTQPNQMLQTVLGSCVAACMRDPIAKVAGMNHFLLPEQMDGTTPRDVGHAARFGAFAMEKLINGLLKYGAMRHRLEVKVFGGANINNQSNLIGSKNVAFVRQFLSQEGMKIISEDLGGNYPRRVHYFADTGKVMLRCLRRTEDMRVVDEEKQYAKSVIKPLGGDVELFS